MRLILQLEPQLQCKVRDQPDNAYDTFPSGCHVASCVWSPWHIFQAAKRWLYEAQERSLLPGLLLLWHVRYLDTLLDLHDC